eukprot:6103780-Amphidinium_carterae.1
MSADETKRAFNRLKTAVKHEGGQAQQQWEQICKLPPRENKNQKKADFLHKYTKSLSTDGRPFGPSFWRKTETVAVNEYQGDHGSYVSFGRLCQLVGPEEAHDLSYELPMKKSPKGRELFFYGEEQYNRGVDKRKQHELQTSRQLSADQTMDAQDMFDSFQ